MKKVNVYSLEDMRIALEEAKKYDKRNKSLLGLRGEFFFEGFREGKSTGIVYGSNLFTTQGRNHVLDVVVGATNKSINWYIGIFKGNYTPIASNTAANSLGVGGLYNECQDADYDPATNRPAYIVGTAVDGSISNATSRAEYTFKTNVNVYGMFIVNSQAKTSTSGVLLAAKRFDNMKSMAQDDVGLGWYVLSLVQT